ncbi:MAG: ATP-binding cassette domain-containing protein [Mariniphaga sp.]
MLKVENISTGYGKKQVLFDISFEVNKGDIVLLAGSNGSGKSSLLKAIFGLLPLWHSANTIGAIGAVIFNGENIAGKPTSVLLEKGLLYIPQKNNLFEDLTVKENLEMAGLSLDKKKLQHRIENTLTLFTSLVQHRNRTPMKMSGGERQLLTLAMATLHEPKLLLIDEPFTGLSPQNITFVADNLKALNVNNGITLLIVEHRVKECTRIANKVIGLKLGRVFSKGEVNKTFDVNSLNQVFV